jgi:hypothetical protein
METLSVYYNFTFPDEIEELFHLEFNTKNFELVNNIPEHLPSWTNLTYHQCSHCPLDVKTHPYCPLAANQVDIVKRIATFLPYQEVQLDVIMGERKISQHTTLQAAVGSFMGLIMPTSGCPHTAFFRPMARFHVPLASSAETIYRSVSMYFMAQYFLHQQGQEIDFELKGLGEIYENIHLVNTSIAERFLAASKQDSSVDAVVQLDIYAMTFLGILEEPLEEIRYLFDAFLTDQTAS